MKTEIDIAFALLRGAVEGSVPDVGAKDTRLWWDCFKLMRRHHVVAICYDVATQCAIPREVMMPWLSEREKAIDWHRYQTKVQQDIVDSMQRNGIATRILKGTRLAKYYPKPEVREFGDLDLYFGKHHAEADEVAQRELNVTIDREAHHHTRYEYQGVTVESHYDFFNSHYPGSNKRYNLMLASLEPSSTFDVLHYIRHAAIHFADRGLNLRDLCDWAMLVSNGKDIDWEKVGKEVEWYGMDDFVAALDDITQTQLGIASPLQMEVHDDTARRMVIDLFCNEPPRGAVSQYFHNRWKRRLAFGDSLANQLVHKTISHISH